MKGMLIRVDNGERHELQAVSILGRSPEGQILIPDPRVSRRHAMIRKQDDGYWFYDLGSFNGTYLNGARVTATRKLNHGDVIDFAENHYRFEQEGGAFDGDLDDLGGSTVALIRSTPVIILVSDIEGFTTLSEKMEADDLAQVIGGWYGGCEQIMATHGATLDKFIGDCVLAYWTDTSTDNRMRALAAVRDLFTMCQQTYEDRQELFDSLGLTFSAGAAMHLGKVAYGGMSQGEFTLVGDPVNLTFRMETLTRTIGNRVLASADMLNGWPDGNPFFENLGIHQVKGRAQPVEIYGATQFPA
jgi:adenylate cyclase